MLRLLLCLLVAVFVAGTFASEQCYSATSEAECAAIGSCVAVKGEHCKEDMTPPPCDLQFTIEQSEECCDRDSSVEDASHIKFLGCEPASEFCGIQCMESLQPQTLGEVFIIWEGCAISSDIWKDVSESDACKSCYDEACPTFLSHLDLLLLLAIIPFGIALLIAVGLVALAVAALVRRRVVSNSDTGNYQRMEMSVEMVPTETEEEAASGTQAVDENGVIQVRRLSDGNIRIPMADGSFRVVSSDAYQKLYLKQQKKRYEQYKKSQPAV